jgi:putative selenium metabolism protein SsnA
VILNNATLVTFWASKPFLEGALIALEGRTIVDFGTAGKLIDRYDDPQILDVGGRIVMPGLVNAHTHLRRTLAQGMPVKGEPPRSFEDIQESLWWKFDRALSKEDVYLAAKVGLLDSVRAGVTTVIDHHSSPANIPGSLDVVEQAFAEVGVRGSLAYATTDRYGERASRASVEENRRFLERRKSETSEMMTGLFGLESSSSVSEETLDRAVGVANELDSSFHVHVSEDVVDLEKSRLEYGATPVQRLTAKGVLREGSLAVHCVRLDGEDYRHLKRSKARVVLNPQSNADGGVGAADVSRFRSAGIPMALGTDGFTAGVLEEFRAAALLQRVSGRHASGARREASQAAFVGNSLLATKLFGSTVGKIKPGARADLLVLDYRPATPLGIENLDDHLFFGLSRAPAYAVVINGRLVFQQGVFPGVDELRLRARAQEAAARLWKRL